jgi:hypothetical protein
MNVNIITYWNIMLLSRKNNQIIFVPVPFWKYPPWGEDLLAQKTPLVFKLFPRNFFKYLSDRLYRINAGGRLNADRNTRPKEFPSLGVSFFPGKGFMVEQGTIFAMN